ncbi:MarR family winged helix-turn-helix transcriptional regulator [Amycolatopsis pithecellobii]|uniref:MarR family transcriptional regulator n=1 Tax=Amycolatopsis pithecellobii TaxID=664692 RepID=A0A6N7Z4Z0_9PSEU|nr:MarR family transcriptional regulator [Amycolatopsis pithecellobii]MTD56569.1 MarR family transcriptional regulator [Amycolatopsis pithecellobii]
MPRKSDRQADSEVISASTLGGAAFPEVSMQVTRRRIAGLHEVAASLGILLTRSALAHVQEAEARVHRPAGWSWSGFRIMYIIWMFGEVEARDVARISGVSRQTTSSVLATLESKGLVDRQRTSTQDKRLIAVRLTPEGKTAFEKAFVEQNELDSEIFTTLTSEEQLTLQRLLQRVLTQITASLSGDD